MSLSKILMVVIAGVFLSACTATETTTAAQQRYNSVDGTLSHIGIQTKTCLDAVWDSHPELGKILSVDRSSDPQKAKNNKDHIRKSDKGAMSALISESTQCRTNGYDRIKNHPDYFVRSFAPLSKESIDLRDEVFQKYLEGKITGGEAASSLTNISEYLKAKWDAHNQQIVDTLDQQHFQQLQAQYAAQAAMLRTIGSGFQNYSNQQKQLYQQQQANKPVQTQCRWIGEVMNCTSY